MTGQVASPAAVARREGVQEPLGTGDGYPVADVRLAARDIGIDEKYVERALIEHGVGAGVPGDVVQSGGAMQERVNPLVGAHTRLEFEVTIPGELADADFEDVADEIRRSIGDVGTLNNIGRSVTWTSFGTPTSQRKLQLTVSSRNGCTGVRGFEDLSQLMGGIFGGVIGGVGGGASARCGARPNAWPSEPARASRTVDFRAPTTRAACSVRRGRRPALQRGGSDRPPSDRSSGRSRNSSSACGFARASTFFTGRP